MLKKTKNKKHKQKQPDLGALTPQGVSLWAQAPPTPALNCFEGISLWDVEGIEGGADGDVGACLPRGRGDPLAVCQVSLLPKGSS